MSFGLTSGRLFSRYKNVLEKARGGVWVIDAHRKVLGRILTGVAAANVALSLDRRHLYITASEYLLRIELKK